MSRLILCTLPVLLAVATSACGDDVQTPASPTTPTNFTERFSGTLTRNGAQTHNFDTQASGTVTATLNVLTPDTATVGLALGTWNGAVCQIVLANDRAVVTTVLQGGVSAVGRLCVRLYDVGTLAQPTNYEVVVVHP